VSLQQKPTTQQYKTEAIIGTILVMADILLTRWSRPTKPTYVVSWVSSSAPNFEIGQGNHRWS
jgi:hypothetical protein